MSNNESPRTGIEILLTFLVACLVVLVGMLSGNRQVFLMCAALSGIAIVVVIIGHVIGLLVDRLRQWHRRRQEERSKTEWRIEHGFKR